MSGVLSGWGCSHPGRVVGGEGGEASSDLLWQMCFGVN